MADIEFFPDEEGEEEEGTEEQRTNRTFIILVGALGGLLALAICVFVAWMLIIGPRAADSIEEQNQAIEATNAARSAAVAATETAAAALPTATAVPTDTPLPTNTPRPTATKPPTVAPTAVVTGTVGEVAQELTISPQPTASSMGRAVPETGIGVLGAGVAGAGLVFLIAVVRRMRRAS